MQAAMLSDAEIGRYHEDGFIVPDFRLSEDTLENIKKNHADLIERHPEFADYCPTLLAYDTGFLNYARTPEILAMVEQLIGSDFALWNSSFFAKPAKVGSKTPWHQDGQYWPIRPIANCTVWLAIDAATRENGCLRLVPGTHKAQKTLAHKANEDPGLSLNQELQPSEFDESTAVDIELAPGQMVLFDVFLVHGSEANRSEKPRRGMTLRFMPTTSHFDRDLATRQHMEMNLIDHAARTLYLMRGTDRCGRNDYTMKR